MGRRLLAHYDRHARDLPWRRTADPYAIWVAEVMLQQTQVATAAPYYERWMARFPTVERLASSDREHVLEAWAGLGYYARARNLHRAAQIVSERHGGRLPDTATELRTLPGVGEYTAGAVASIAFGRLEPAVDGNVRRVLSRLFDMERPTPRGLREVALAVLDPDRAGDSNQALMELGATICRPRAPECGECPLAADCLALERGTVERRPPRPPRSRVPEVDITAFVTVDDRERTLMVRRPESGLLAGLWEFPSREGRPERPALEPVIHRFSHLEATYYPVPVEGPPERALLTAAGWPGSPSSRSFRVLPLRELAAHAVPVGQRKIAERVLAVRAADRSV